MSVIIKCKRLNQLTTRESVWLEMLKRSNLVLHDSFSAKRAVEAIKDTPTKKGRRLLDVPTHHKIFVALKKSEDFKRIPGARGCVEWALK